MRFKKQNIQLKKLLLMFFVLLISLSARTQEFVFKDFKHLKGNTTARIYRQKDVNGQNCAVLIIKHNFNNFIVESGKGYERLEEKIGETWIWLTSDEYRLVIRKENNIPFSFDLKGKLNPLETYELVLITKVAQKDAQLSQSSVNNEIKKEELKNMSNEDKCILGMNDADNLHGKGGAHFLYGVAFGAFAVIGSAVSKPSPEKGSSTSLMSQNNELFFDPTYRACYTKKARKNNVRNTAAGWATFILAFIVVSSSN